MSGSLLRERKAARQNIALYHLSGTAPIIVQNVGRTQERQHDGQATQVMK